MMIIKEFVTSIDDAKKKYNYYEMIDNSNFMDYENAMLYIEECFYEMESALKYSISPKNKMNMLTSIFNDVFSHFCTIRTEYGDTNIYIEKRILNENKELMELI